MHHDPLGEALTIGQLSDDVAALDEILEPDQVVSVGHHLAHLVGILNRLGTQDRP